MMLSMLPVHSSLAICVSIATRQPSTS